MRILMVKFPLIDLAVTEKMCELAEKLEYDIAAILSLDTNETCTEVCGYPVISLYELQNISWDAAILSCDGNVAEDIIPQLVDLGIGRKEQFKDSWWLIQQLMIQKYAEVKDPDIQATLEYWKTHKISLFNQHIDLNKGARIPSFLRRPVRTAERLLSNRRRRLSQNVFPAGYEFHREKRREVRHRSYAGTGADVAASLH